MVDAKEQLPNWARRVPRDKIRRLYAADARGIVDEELIDEVGYSMYARCQSILTVTAAHSGRVACPLCTAVVERSWPGAKDEALLCVCGWRTTWGAYFKSYQRKQLHGGGATPAFEVFSDRWPRAATPRDKLLLIDGLIHELHVNAKVARFARPAACNVIEGSMKDVSALLDELAYGDLSTPGLGAARERWRGRLDTAHAAMKEWRTARMAGKASRSRDS